MTASLEVVRKKPDPKEEQEDREDTDRVDDLESGSVPVDGASIEEVMDDELPQ